MTEKRIAVADCFGRRTYCAQLKGLQSLRRAYRVRRCTGFCLLPHSLRWCVRHFLSFTATVGAVWSPIMLLKGFLPMGMRSRAGGESQTLTVSLAERASLRSFASHSSRSPLDRASQPQVNEEVLPCTLVDVRSPEEVAEAPAESFGVTHRVFNVAGANRLVSTGAARASPATNARAAAHSSCVFFCGAQRPSCPR